MAYTQADVNALRAKITKLAGANRIQHGDRSVSYDLKEARKLLAVMEAEVATTNGKPRRRVLRLTQTGDGL